MSFYNRKKIDAAANEVHDTVNKVLPFGLTIRPFLIFLSLLGIFALYWLINIQMDDSAGSEACVDTSCYDATAYFVIAMVAIMLFLVMLMLFKSFQKACAKCPGE